MQLKLLSISCSLNLFEQACIMIETPALPRNTSQLLSCSPASTHCDRKPAGPQPLPAHNSPVDHSPHAGAAFIDIPSTNASFQVSSSPSSSPRLLAAARGTRAVTPSRCKPSHCTLHLTHWHALHLVPTRSFMWCFGGCGWPAVDQINGFLCSKCILIKSTSASAPSTKPLDLAENPNTRAALSCGGSANQPKQKSCSMQ